MEILLLAVYSTPKRSQEIPKGLKIQQAPNGALGLLNLKYIYSSTISRGLSFMDNHLGCWMVSKYLWICLSVDNLSGCSQLTTAIGQPKKQVAHNPTGSAA